MFYEEKTPINLLIWEKQCVLLEEPWGLGKFLKSSPETLLILQPNSWKLEAKIWSISHITWKPNSRQSQTCLRGQSSSIFFYLQFTGQVWNFSMRMDRVRGVLVAGTERPSRRSRTGTTSETLSSWAKHLLQRIISFFTPASFPESSSVSSVWSCPLAFSLSSASFNV